MRLTLVILLVVGTAAVLVSAQNSDQRRQARARFRALAQAARDGDLEAQNILKARRRQRPRQRAQPTRSSAVPPRPVFQDAVEEPKEVSAPVRVRVPVRRNRVRVQPQVEVTTFHPTTTQAPATFAPEEVFPEVQETIIIPEPVTEATVIEEPVFPKAFEEPRSRRIRPQSRPSQPQRVVQSRPVDDFNINFDLEPHKALNSGLEIDSRSEHIVPRFTDSTTVPPVETIRRYSYFDEQGNYVFGYEAADGSFKEEVRRLDCVVEGKYGYVDPEGIRREFTYTSGNKCDPNAVPDPDTQELPPLPLNDQFLQQTQEQQLTQEELDRIQFNRRRRPVQTVQPNEETVVTPSRRRRPTSRTSVRPARPSPIPVRDPEPVLVRQPEPVFPQVTEAPIIVTPAPAPRFTTPASFNRFKTQGTLEPVQEVRRPQPTSAPTRVRLQPTSAPTRVRLQPTSAPARAPVQEQDIRPAHQAFQPPEGPSFRPTPKPIAFDFDKEFNSLFNNFARPRPSTHSSVFTPRPTTRLPPPPTTRAPPPPPPTTRAPPPPPPPPPSTFQPSTSHSSLDDGSQTLSSSPGVANQLVFDAASGTFTNVKVNTGTSSFLPKPAPNPFAPRPSSAPTTLASRPPPPSSLAPSPFSAATPAPTPAATGRPLPLSHFNPASHFVINQNGRSPAAAEFDKFFSQFNLKF